ESERLFGFSERMEQHARQQRADGMQLILEGSDDAKIPTTTAQAPEEVSVLAGASDAQFAVSGDDISGEQIIAGQAAFSRQPAEAAAEGEPGDTGVGD